VKYITSEAVFDLTFVSKQSYMITHGKTRLFLPDLWIMEKFAVILNR